MVRILLLLTSGVFCSSALSEQEPDEVEANVAIDIVYGHDYGMAMTFDVYLPS